MSVGWRSFVLSLVASVGLICPSWSAPVTGVTATTSLGDYNPGTFNTIQQTVDGTTLSAFSLTGVTIGQPGWFANNSGPVGVIDYNLNGSFILNQLGFWNAEGFNLGFGVIDALLETSSDGLIYTPLTGAGFTGGVYTFAPGLNGTGNLPEIVSFNPVTASYVRFNLLTNYNGSTFPGYQAVVFDGVAAAASVPEIDAGSASIPVVLVLISLFAVSDRRRLALQQR